MFCKYIRIVGVDYRVLGRLCEEVVRVTQQVLVNWIVAGQQHGKAFVVASAAAARLLPTAGDRARVVHQEGNVERADVDPKLKRIGGGNATKVAVEQILLDLSAFVG
jgi:hypothetical protein